MNTITMNKVYNVHTIWITMMLLTIATYLMGKHEYSGTTFMFIILIAAGVKAAFIIRDFMELRGVSFLWRSIMYGWLLFVCTGIAISYMIGR